MELSIHINTDSPTDIASARAVLDFVERGISDAPREPFVPVPLTAADAAADSPPLKRPRKRSTKAEVKAAVNGRTSTDERQLALPGTELPPKLPPTPDLSSPDNAARAVHAKSGRVSDVLDLLAPFKVTRVSELTEAQGVEFVAAAIRFVEGA